MEQGREVRAMLALLRAGLWGGTDPDMDKIFPLTQQEWDDVFLLSRRQTVLGLTYRGLDFLADDMQPPMALAVKWMAHVDRIEAANAKMDKAVCSLFSKFAQKGVAAVLQKGQGMARMYPEPHLRECGDIDLYFPGHDGESDPLEGIFDAQRQRMPDHSWSYEADGVIIEHHPFLLDIQNPLRQKYIRSLIAEKGFEKVPVGDEDPVEVTVPAPEVNLLLLSSHILKHALGVGIGLRQICDYAVACRYYAGRVDQKEMREIWRRAGLSRWSELLDGFVSDVIAMRAKPDLRHCEEGLRPDVAILSSQRHCEKRSAVAISSKKSSILLDIILKGGNFGVYSKDRAVASRNVLSRKAHTLKSFVGNMRFALAYAPGEWFWTAAQLMGGQLR